MGTTKEIILDIEVNNKVAIDNIVKLTKQLEDLKVAQTQLDGAYKLGTKTAEEYDKENTALQAQIRNVKNQIREYNKEIDANIQKQEAQEGSLKQMRAELKNMVKEYDSLSAADRQSDMGANLRDNIKELTDQLKNLEGETGRFQRNVGDYRNAIKEALNGNINLKTALKELKTELQTLSFQQRQQIEDINKQKAALDELATTLGKDSAEYKKAEQDLLKMQKDYDDTTKSINDMSIAAGNMQDVLSDTSASIKNFGTDNANIKATAAGLGVLANSYTVLQAGMASLGAESEELVKVWAKVQLVQQGINAINQIANALEKESILRQQLRILTNKLLGKSMAQTTAAKEADAAASVKAAAADVKLAAGETAATAASGGLVKGLKAVNAALKSIPLIGLLASATAAITTIVALIVKANRAEKEGNETLKERRRLINEINDLQKQTLESTQESVVKMESNIRHLKDLEEGTEEWDMMVKQVASDLGVTEEWLKNNIDKVDDLKDAWVRLQQAMALGEAAAKKMAENQIKSATARADIEQMLDEHQDESIAKQAKALQEQFKMSKKVAKEMAKLYKAQKETGKAEDFVKYANFVNDWVEGLLKGNEQLKNIEDQAFEDQIDAQNDLKEIAGDGIKETGETIVKTANKTGKEVLKSTKQLTEELEDLIISNMTEGLYKQIKQVEVASKRWIEKMKEARDKDLENKDIYDSLIEEKEKQTQAKIEKIREAGFKAIAEQSKKITETYNSILADTQNNPLAALKTLIKKTSEETESKIHDLNKSIATVYGTAQENFEGIFGVFSKMVEKFDEEVINTEIAKLFQDFFNLSEESAKNTAKKITQILKQEASIDGLLNEEDSFQLIGIDTEDKLVEMKFSVQSLFKLIVGNLAKTHSEFSKILNDFDQLQNDEKQLHQEVEKAGKARIGFSQEELIVRKKVNAEYAKAAQENLDKLLKQAERDALDNIPDSFSVYIDFQIEDLEQKIAEEKDKLSKYKLDNDTENIEKSEEAIEQMNNELAKQYDLRMNISKATELEMRELKANAGVGLGFYDSQELIQTQIEMEKVQNQIDAVNESKRQGIAIEEQVASQEAQLANEREKYHNNLQLMTEEERADEEKRLEERQNEINELKLQMAAIGYTGSESMDQLLEELGIKMQSLSKQTVKIWQNNVKTVLSAFQQVTNSFSDLMNAIGEDNAEMTNFLEGLAYVNIGVNLAVAISEAVSSGAGMPFPYNLAAIAAGVAAVISAIASAISTYKQYHKQVSSPSFATGGVIGGRTARTREEGRRDDVPIWASKGEYVINADKVKEYGIDFFDAINFGKKMRKLNISGKYAEGGMINQTTIQQVSSQTPNYEGLVEALQAMPNPIVSVKEITSTQRRVQAKENISKK